jgi:Leucine-rich repeat (LRR) protein
VNINNNNFTQLPASCKEWTHIKKLWMENNKLTDLPDMSEWSLLEKFFINGNKLTKIPDSIEGCKGITDFYCNENQLNEFPKGI